MSEEPLAVSKIPPAPAAQGDYDAICAALMHTERGRWFLQEYARRSRGADTQILLGAIERIESVVRAEGNRQAHQSFRSDLLEMAKAITRTRAEVAEIKSQATIRIDSAGLESQSSAATARAESADIFAAAERIRDVTWAMRGRGFDPSTCNQLEELAASILCATSLRDPNDRRVRKLSEVLQYLEYRIDTLLENCADGVASAPQADHDETRPGDVSSSPASDPSCDPALALEVPAPVISEQNDDSAPWSDFPPVETESSPPADKGCIERPPGMPPETPVSAPAAPPGSITDRAAELATKAELAVDTQSEPSAAMAAPGSALWNASEAREGGAGQGEPYRSLAAPVPAAAVPGQPAAEPIPPPPPNDPLAALRAMSDIERIALFT